MNMPDRSGMRRPIVLTLPLALHVIPTLAIGFGFIIPGSPIDGLNQYTIGFAAAVLGFIPTYVAGLSISAKTRSNGDD